MMRWLVALLACTAASSAACGEGFAPYSRLTTLRVLALRSEPVAPGVGETTTLSALVYARPNEPVVEYRWSWCPFAGPSSGGYVCQISEAELTQLAGGAVPPYDLGSGETASFTHSLDSALLEAICNASMPGQPALVDCTGGFPISLKLVVRTASEEVTTVRNLRLRFRPEHEASANPTIDGLVAVVGGGDVPLAAAPGPTLTRREETAVRVSVPDSASESFTSVDDQGRPVSARERLVLSWFVESGDVSDERTAFIDGVVQLADALQNDWEPDIEREYPRQSADIVVVVRDDRDGVAWIRGTATLGAAQ
jgi:hypothetical protein